MSTDDRAVPTFLILSIALAAFLFATNLYRARTQSITIDEAFTFNHFIASQPDAAASNAPYNENLNTWLCLLSVRLWGASEFSMRIPSVLGGLLYLAALIRLCRLLFGDSPWLLVAVAANSLNPFLLDYLSAARGYGLAVGFFTLAAYYLARYLAEPAAASNFGGSWILTKAGIALGLAVTSHVTETFAVIAVEAALALVLIADFLIASDWAGALRFLWRGFAPCVAATLIVAAVFLWLPARRFRVAQLDDLFDRYKNGIKALVAAIFFYKPTLLTAWDVRNGPLHRLVWLFVPALLTGLALSSVWILRRTSRKTGGLREQRPLLLFSIATLLTFLLLWIETRVFHHGYFGGRRLLFTLPLLSISGVQWIRWLMRERGPFRAIGWIGSAALGILLLNFALEYNLRSYYGWEFDAGTQQAVRVLEQAHARASQGDVRLASTWFLNESLNFYRRVNKLDWLAEVTRDSPVCFYDYYYVVADDLGSLGPFGVRELYRDHTARTVLAEVSPLWHQRLAALREVGFPHLPPCTANLVLEDSHLKLGQPKAVGHLLHDFMEQDERAERRWTFERPALLFAVPRRPNTRFRMDFVLAAQTFSKTGPIRMTVWLNGKPLGQAVYGSPEQHSFEAAVAPELLRDDGVALIETTLDKYFVADDGVKLGYLFESAGFTP